MGFKTELVRGRSFIYKSELENGLIEHEHDTVFIGFVPEKFSSVVPNKEEVSDYRWVFIDQLVDDIERNHSIYTPWLLPALQLALADLSKSFDELKKGVFNGRS